MLHGGGDISVMSQGSRETQTRSPTWADWALGVSRGDSPRDPSLPSLPRQEQGTQTGLPARLLAGANTRSCSSQQP